MKTMMTALVALTMLTGTANAAETVCTTYTKHYDALAAAAQMLKGPVAEGFTVGTTTKMDTLDAIRAVRAAKEAVAAAIETECGGK